MTKAISLDHALYWSESLAEELLQFLTRRLRCSDTATVITHETYIRFCQTSQATPVNNARALASALPSIWRLITSVKPRSGVIVRSKAILRNLPIAS